MEAEAADTEVTVATVEAIMVEVATEVGATEAVRMDHRAMEAPEAMAAVEAMEADIRRAPVTMVGRAHVELVEGDHLGDVQTGVPHCSF